MKITRDRARALWMEAVRDKKRVTSRCAKIRPKRIEWEESLYSRDYSAFLGVDVGSAETIGMLVDVAIIAEDDGVVSVIALGLPGTGSSGETEREAIENFKEAMSGVLASFEDDSECVTWLMPSEYSIPVGARRAQILVNV